MSKEISDILHLIKNKCYYSIWIDIIVLIDTNKYWYNSFEIMDIIDGFKHLTLYNVIAQKL